MDPQLAATLVAEDAAEDRGMTPADRLTCHTCQSWADHAHDPLTGRRISLAVYEERRKALGA